ncbi:MAG: Glyoxalase/bleomycin resistance protein/dioxygenase [Bacteroidetes bacterium]|jgi:predicted enzyme related to lactoylglutathione lyase|nr:Glyoxalase/bleomycin resistance protein/dioxygenase [Bacteroidota bacterium]
MKQNPVVHFEMPYENPQRVSSFYSKAFGWNMHALGNDMDNYILAGTTEVDDDMMIKEPGSINGGFFLKKPDLPPYPSVVISVDNIDEAMKRVTEAGGKINGEPSEIPGIGKFVALTDTEGNYVGMLQPEKK